MTVQLIIVHLTCTVYIQLAFVKIKLPWVALLSSVSPCTFILLHTSVSVCVIFRQIWFHKDSCVDLMHKLYGKKHWGQKLTMSRKFWLRYQLCFFLYLFFKVKSEFGNGSWWVLDPARATCHDLKISSILTCVSPFWIV